MANRHELDATMYDPVTFYNQNSLNLIIDERIKFDREYIILDRSKILDCINDPDSVLSILNSTELTQLFKQALEADYIDEIKYNQLINDNSLLYDLILMNNIQELLIKQYTYITKIPSISDLENNGLIDSIINVIQLHPELVIDQPLVGTYTDEYLINALTTNNFISFNATELILDDTMNILTILGTNDAVDLFNRVKPYLSFVTDEIISSAALGTLLFTSNDIKIIIDKEIELKYLLLKTLTPNHITKMFNEFKDELISINIVTMVNEQFQILQDELLSVNYDDLVKDQVDNYLTTVYNNLLRDTLNNAFQKFKDEFINIDLQVIIQGYFDEMKAELFGADYDALIITQVETYMANNTDILTDTQVQSWIQNTIQ